MSSSDAPPAPQSSLRGFALGLGITTALIMAIYAGAALLIDPMGATPGNRLCAGGIKAEIRLGAKSLVARREAPATIMLGNSRVDNAFGTATLARLGPAPRVNLATSDAMPAEMAALARDAMAGGRLRLAYVGVDFNLAVSPRDPGPVNAIADAPLPWLEAMRRTWFGTDVFQAISTVPPDCTKLINADGTSTPARLESRPRPGASPRQMVLARKEYARRAQELRHLGSRRTQARLAELRAIVRDLRQSGVGVVLFAGPVRSQLDIVQRETGLTRAAEDWNRQVARMAKEEGALYLDLRGQAALDAAGVPVCPQGGADCHFRDLTHYSATVGAALARPLAQAGETVLAAAQTAP
jgi:hypothetical protein